MGYKLKSYCINSPFRTMLIFGIFWVPEQPTLNLEALLRQGLLDTKSVHHLMAAAQVEDLAGQPLWAIRP